jgi:hypothetical protein
MRNQTTKAYKFTQEEEALGRLLEVNQDTLSSAAHILLGEAKTVAYALYLVSTYSFQPEEYEEALQKMRPAAAILTVRDRDLLAELVDAGKAAADSIDPDDETPAGYKVCRGDVHCYYVTAYSIVEEMLQNV